MRFSLLWKWRSMAVSYVINEKEKNESKGLFRTLPVCPIGPSIVSPSMKLGESAPSFLPRVIISPKFWNLVATRVGSQLFFYYCSKSILSFSFFFSIIIWNFKKLNCSEIWRASKHGKCIKRFEFWKIKTARQT